MEPCIVAPLDIHEKKLIDRFQSQFAVQTCDSVKKEDIARTFENWIWTRKLKVNFAHAFNPEFPTSPASKGDSGAAWQSFLSLLNYNELNFLYFRTIDLENSNPTLPHDLRLCGARSAKIVHFDEDARYWSFLAQIFWDNFVGIPNSWQLTSRQAYDCMREDWPCYLHDIQSSADDIYNSDTRSLLDSSSENTPASRDRSVGKFPFRIQGLVHKCSILQRRGLKSNCQKVLKCLFSDQKLAMLYEPLGQDGTLSFKPYKDYDQYLKTLAPLSGQFEAVWLATYGDTGYGVIEDPRDFVEVIPWEELSARSLPDESPGEYVLWKTERRLPWDHHLFTEEEVFRYCILHNFTFPGHLQNENVCFQMTQLKDRAFVELIFRFWDMWNDCAVTQNPSTEEWFLLETLPGRKFRALWNQVDRGHAIQYFRKVADHHRYGDSMLLQNVLHTRYRPEYENLLSMIPFEQIQIDTSAAFRGSRGVVYKGLWRPLPRFGMPERKEFMVALKFIPSHRIDDLEDFIIELDSTLTAVSGISTNVVELYGITKSGSAEPLPLPSDALFLVLELAQQGSSLEFFQNVFNGERSDWTWIFSFLLEMASGLLSLHSREIIHRDLHWGNVLVTTRHNANSPLQSMTTQFLIADLGEGKLQTAASLPTSSHGKVEFQAPEVRKFHQYSKSSDVFDLGWLTSEAIALHWSRKGTSSTIKPQDDAKEIPTTILNLIRQSLNQDPDGRICARDLVNALEKETIRIFEATEGARADVNCNYPINPDLLEFEEYNGDLFGELNEDGEMP